MLFERRRCQLQARVAVDSTLGPSNRRVFPWERVSGKDVLQQTKKLISTLRPSRQGAVFLGTFLPGRNRIDACRLFSVPKVAGRRPGQVVYRSGRPCAGDAGRVRPHCQPRRKTLRSIAASPREQCKVPPLSEPSGGSFVPAVSHGGTFTRLDYLLFTPSFTAPGCVAEPVLFTPAAGLAPEVLASPRGDGMVLLPVVP